MIQNPFVVKNGEGVTGGANKYFVIFNYSYGSTDSYDYGYECFQAREIVSISIKAEASITAFDADGNVISLDNLNITYGRFNTSISFTMPNQSVLIRNG